VNISKELVIIMVIALLILGPTRLAGLGGALGKTIRDFRKSMEDPAAERQPEQAPKAQGNR
jgi:sec-independent protein translocase protein TatA